MKISRERYGSGAYFAATRHFYEEVFEDDSLSARGGAESASFMKRLGTFLARKRFLFRLLLKVGNCEAESDVVMLHETGIYAFKSKISAEGQRLRTEGNMGAVPKQPQALL